MFKATEPLTIHSAAESDGIATFEVSSGSGNATLSFRFESAKGIRVYNATQKTEELLGSDLVGGSYRTIIGSVQRCGPNPVFPIVVPCWWQGGGTPGWVE